MLIAHISDTHLGASQFNLKEREEDVYEAFQEVIETALKDRVELMIHSGDIFDAPKPSGTALVKLVSALQQLKERGVKFFFTLGEHDISRIPDIPSPFLFEKVGLATYVGDGQPITHNGLLLVGFHRHRKSEIDALVEKMRNLDSTLTGHSGKKILVLHQGLYEAHQWAGDISSADMPKTFDYYAMGHLHNRFEKHFDGLKGLLCYPGSIDPTSGEGIKEFRKGFYLVDLSGAEADPEWIEIKSSRKQFSLELEYNQLNVLIEELIERLQGLSKKPVLSLRIKGKNIESGRVSKVLEPIRPHILYQVWEPVEEREEGRVYSTKPADIEDEMLKLAVKITGSPEKAAFAVKELLPLLADGRTDEAFELMWKAYEEGRIIA